MASLIILLSYLEILVYWKLGQICWLVARARIFYFLSSDPIINNFKIYIFKIITVITFFFVMTLLQIYWSKSKNIRFDKGNKINEHKTIVALSSQPVNEVSLERSFIHKINRLTNSRMWKKRWKIIPEYHFHHNKNPSNSNNHISSDIIKIYKES